MNILKISAVVLSLYFIPVSHAESFFTGSIDSNKDSLIEAGKKSSKQGWSNHFNDESNQRGYENVNERIENREINMQYDNNDAVDSKEKTDSGVIRNHQERILDKNDSHKRDNMGSLEDQIPTSYTTEPLHQRQVLQNSFSK